MTKMKNNYSFTVAAILAAMAAAGECPDTVEYNGDNFYDGDWKANYMEVHDALDSCPHDFKISLPEYEKYTDYPLEDFMLGDSNQDGYVTVQEGLRYHAAKVTEPFVVTPEESYPYADRAKELFDYLDCRPTLEGEACNGSYDRTDLRAVLPYLHKEAADLVTDRFEYDLLVSYEMALRDMNRDGEISYAEHTVFTEDYQELYDSLEDKGDFEAIWRVQQEDKINSVISMNMYGQIPKSNEMQVTRQEMVDYLTNVNPESTPSDIQKLAEEYFARLDSDIAGKAHILQFKANQLKQEKSDKRLMEEEMIRFYEETWYTIDQDRNKIANFSDFIISGVTDEHSINENEHLIKEIFDFCGYDTVVSQVHADDFYEKIVIYEKNTYAILKDHWTNAWNKGESSYTVHLAGVIGNFAAWQVLGVSSSEEVTELFTSIDKNSDGVIDGNEACRHYIADYDFMCEKFQHKPHWLNMLEHWEFGDD